MQQSENMMAQNSFNLLPAPFPPPIYTAPQTYQAPPAPKQGSHRNYFSSHRVPFNYVYDYMPETQNTYPVIEQPLAGSAELQNNPPSTSNNSQLLRSLLMKPPSSDAIQIPKSFQSLMHSLDEKVETYIMENKDAPQKVLDYVVSNYKRHFCKHLESVEKQHREEVERYQKNHDRYKKSTAANRNNLVQKLKTLTNSKSILENALENAEKDKDTFKGQASIAYAQVVQQGGKLQEVRNQLDQAYSTIRQLEAKNRDLKKRFQSAYFEGKALEKKCEEEQLEHLNMQENLKKELTMVNKNLQAITKVNYQQVHEIQRLTGKNMSLKKRVDLLETKVNEEKGKIKRVEKQLANSTPRVTCKALRVLEKVRRSKEKLARDKKEMQLKSEKKRLQKANARKDSEIRQLNQQLDDNMETFFKQLEDLETDLKKSETRNRTFKRQHKPVVELVLKVLSLKKSFYNLAFKMVHYAEKNKMLKLHQQEIGIVMKDLENVLQDAEKENLDLTLNTHESTSRQQRLIEAIRTIKERLDGKRKTFWLSENKPVLEAEDLSTLEKKVGKKLLKRDLETYQIEWDELKVIVEKLETKYLFENTVPMKKLNLRPQALSKAASSNNEKLPGKEKPSSSRQNWEPTYVVSRRKRGGQRKAKVAAKSSKNVGASFSLQNIGEWDPRYKGKIIRRRVMQPKHN